MSRLTFITILMLCNCAMPAVPTAQAPEIAPNLLAPRRSTDVTAFSGQTVRCKNATVVFAPTPCPF